MNEKLQLFTAIAENTLNSIHESIVTKLILDKLLTEGVVTIEEANFYNKLAYRIIHESSDLFIPSAEEIQEALTLKNIKTIEEGKILVDPETGDKYVYDEETGTLIPAGDDEDVAVEDKDNDGVLDAEEDHGELPDDFKGDHEDAEELKDEEKEEPEEDENLEDKEDVSASCGSKVKEENESNEVQESTETKPEETKKELSENELFIEKLLQKLEG